MLHHDHCKEAQLTAEMVLQINTKKFRHFRFFSNLLRIHRVLSLLVKRCLSIIYRGLNFERRIHAQNEGFWTKKTAQKRHIVSSIFQFFEKCDNKKKQPQKEEIERIICSFRTEKRPSPNERNLKYLLPPLYKTDKTTKQSIHFQHHKIQNSTSYPRTKINKYHLYVFPLRFF